MERIQSIVIVTDRHLCDNPRVWKEANLLAKNNYEVTIIGSWFDAGKRERDLDLLDPSIQIKPAINLIKGESSLLSRLFLKSRTRLALFLKKLINIDSRWLISYDPDAFVKAAASLHSPLILAHVETGLYAGVQLIKRGKSVAFDFEDWYSEDYLVKERPVKFLKKLEASAVKYGAFVYCPSEAMANSIALEYNSHRKIHTIYNGFPISESIKPFEGKIKNETPSIVWFSQTIGPGRGLEFFFEALALVPLKINVDLIGICTSEYANHLRDIFPFAQGHVLTIRKPVKHSELIQEISAYDIGLALEQNFPKSRNKTITNKILQYLQAGIKVLATDTDGQKEIASFFPETVSIVPRSDKTIWAKAIIELINAGPFDRNKQVNKFNEIFSMDVQGIKLLTIIKASISN